jgi:hypothetical protein
MVLYIAEIFSSNIKCLNFFHISDGTKSLVLDEWMEHDENQFLL